VRKDRGVHWGKYIEEDKLAQCTHTHKGAAMSSGMFYELRMRGEGCMMGNGMGVMWCLDFAGGDVP